MGVPEQQPLLRVVWGSRRRGPKEIASALLATLNDLGALDARVLEGWLTRERIPVRRSCEELSTYIANRPTDGLPGLGYELTLVSVAGDDQGYALTVSDGAVADHPIVLNEAVIRPRRRHEGADVLASRAVDVLAVLIKHWAPDAAALYDLQLVRGVPASGPRRPQVGALTWLAGHLAAVPPDLPKRLPGLQVMPLGDGTLLDLRLEDGTWPPVEEVVRLAGLLEDAGVLRDIPQVQSSERAAV